MDDLQAENQSLRILIHQLAEACGVAEYNGILYIGDGYTYPLGNVAPDLDEDFLRQVLASPVSPSTEETT